MRHWQNISIALLLSGLSLFISSPCFAATDEAFQQALSEFLEMGPATELELNAHGRNPDDINKRLSTIYTENGLQPFWIEKGKPGKRATDIISVLADAKSHGLDPYSYFVDLINYYKEKKDPADMARLDILLSIGMMRYVADQREGRIEAREIDPVLFESARDVEVDLVALREEAFNAPDMKAFLQQQAPPFLQYRELRKKLADYRGMAAAGGWPTIAEGETLKPGMDDPRVLSVRQRLSVTGELDSDNLDSSDLDNSVFTPALEAAVRQFQARHNLDTDGAIGKQTLAAMNIPVTDRINQIIVNMERYRWLKRDMAGPMVVVNIAGYRALAGVPGKFDLSMPVVVGKLQHETPVFSDMIKYVVFNPYWTLPPSIARKETLSKLKKDPDYLEKHDMKIFLGWGKDSKQLDASKIDWSKVTKKDMNKYRVRQEPGPKNALGRLKIIFPNKHDIYLHDTPSHSLFKREKRAFSHGCIRLSQPVEMASWVLGGEKNGWGVDRINEVIKSRERKVAVLKEKIPVHILYRTAFVDDNSTLIFYEDVYGRDKLLAGACCTERGAD